MRGSAAFRTGAAPGGALAPRWSKDRLWRAARAVPSLDLNFADSKSLTDGVTGQNLVTFTRSSRATYVDSTGTLRSAVTNLLLRSEALATSPWFSANVTLTNSSTDVQDPIGGFNSTKIVATGSSSAVGQGAIISTASTGSIWLRTASGTASFSLIIYLSGSPFTNIGTANITVTTTWQRFSVTSSTPPSSASYNLQLHSIPATTLYAWGAQLEQSSTVGEYVPTTSTINSAPRFDHNPLTGESLGLLVEAARTNSIRNNTMQGAVAGSPGTLPTNWNINVPTGLTRTISLTTVNGISCIDINYSGTATSSAGIQIQPESNIAASNGQSWTGSAWVQVTQDDPALTSLSYETWLFDGTSAFLSTGASNLIYSTRLTFNRTTIAQTLSNASVAFVKPYYRTNTINSGTTINITLRIGLPQLEQGAFATSPILTSGATATRSADVASITGTNFSGWYQQATGTFLFDGVNPAISTTAFSASDGSISNRLQMDAGTNTRIARVVSGGTTQAGNSTAYAYGVLQRFVLSYATDSINFANAGVLGTEDTSATIPTVNQLRIGAGPAGANPLNSTIKRIVFWPVRLPNTTLQALTQ